MVLAPEADAQEPLSRTWAQRCLPWLSSATVHLTLLLTLAITFGRHDGAARRSLETTGISLEAHLISRSSADREERADGVEVAQSSRSKYFEDENQAPAASAATAAPTTTAGGKSPLLAMLNERPPVDLTGVLPAANNLAGSGRLEGGGVGNARGLTTQSQPASGTNKFRGGATRTGVFGVVGEGHKFIYVFDRSGSMDGHGGLPLAMAKAELISSLRDLGQTHQFQIIFYNEHPQVFGLSGSVRQLVFGTDPNKTLAQRFVGGITADGGTQHEEALMLALQMRPDVIFFLTDADEPRMTPQQMARIERMNHGATINAIEFGYGPQTDSNNFLVQLARQNAGQHVYVDVSRISRGK